MEGFGSMLVMIPLVYGTKNIEWTEERILYARIAFGVVQAAIVLVLLLVNSKIKKAAAHNKINVPKAAPSPFSQSTNEESEEMTVEEYDLKEWNNLFYQGTLLQIAIISFITYKFETVIPLISQVVMGPMKIWGHHLVKAHLRGEDVPRPFPQPKSPLGDLFGAAKEEKKEEKKKDKKKSE